MNHKFNQSVSIDWDRIEYNSYLHGIEALKSIENYRDTTPKELYYERYGGKSLHEQSHGECLLDERKGV